MVKLIVDSPEIQIKNADLKVVRALESVTSFLVEGHRFHRAFKTRRWDGRSHLIKFKRGRYVAPVGLLQDICDRLAKLKVKFKVKHLHKTPEPVEFKWNAAIKLRDYQKDAINAFFSGYDAYCGILKMPIRSGKTKTAGGVIHRARVRALFVVPSQMLLHQTAESMRECFVGVDVGIIGDGEWSEGDITVATIQSLAAAR